MDIRVLFVFVFLTLQLTACGQPDRASAVLPGTSDTCGGAAITNRYIVHYASGQWDYVHSEDREIFKEKYVRPRVDQIDFIEYDQIVRVEASAQFYPANGIDNWGVKAIEAPRAWLAGARGKDIVVAVVDTGVDASHPQLSQRIAYNPGESGANANNGVDDDGNGYVDDYAGYNFFSSSGDTMDDVNHGTHVAGIIAAQHSDTDWAVGYTQGVVPEAKILPVKFLGPNGGSLSAALQGIDYALQRNAKVINASWGGIGCSKSLRQKVTEASNKNVLFVAAAGNSGNNLDLYPEYPAAFQLPLQITVGSIRESLFMDAYSNYSNTLVHLFAPGTAVVSTVPGGGYASFSGTSMATPFVAGAAAVLLARKPTLTLSEVRNALLRSTSADPSYSNVTHGRLNLGAAVDALGQ